MDETVLQNAPMFDGAPEDSRVPALPRKRLAQALREGGAAEPVPCAPGAKPAGSRRRKLWELNARHHCPVIGTCVPMTELRRLAQRARLTAFSSSDYALHAYAVGQAQERGDFAQSLQRLLDRRYAAMIARFSSLRDRSAIRALWQDCCASGEAAAALWAVLTHALCDEALDREVYGEIHMLSHQLGAGQRADLAQLAALQNGLRQLRESAQLERERSARRQEEMAVQWREATAQLAQARCAASRRDAELASCKTRLAELEGGAASAAQARQRAEIAERRLAALRGECVGLQRRLDGALAELAAARAEQHVSEAALRQLTVQAACGTAGDCSGCAEGGAAAHLSGRCLLCIGGRENLVGHYRGLVENLGGRFLHHDGGLENSQKRLEATLASADAVVCQASCVSHSAYWKLKEFCKRHNKPCIYLKSAGVTSFAHGLSQLLTEAPPAGG